MLKERADWVFNLQPKNTEKKYNMNETIKQGDSVKFNLNETIKDLTGKICGKLGPIIIVELDVPLKGYEFSHIYIVDSQIVKPEEA